MREEKIIIWDTELSLINRLGDELTEAGFNASNSIIISVSTDYSSIVGQLLRHRLSFNGEVAEGFGVDVPYPDEEWAEKYKKELYDTFKIHSNGFRGKNLILVEAGVIRGGNYTFLTEWIKKYMPFDGKIITLALYENEGSIFKSDFVGEYYNDTTDDLTFWWERENKHWR
jgi:hypothetical protein